MLYVYYRIKYQIYSSLKRVMLEYWYQELRGIGDHYTFYRSRAKYNLEYWLQFQHNFAVLIFKIFGGYYWFKWLGNLERKLIIIENTRDSNQWFVSDPYMYLSWTLSNFLVLAAGSPQTKIKRIPVSNLLLNRLK